MRRLLLAPLCLCLVPIVSVPARADIVLSQTRLIYHAHDRDASLQMQNAGKAPILTETWMDRGDPDSRPDQVDVPFIVTPPISRIDPGMTQTLRFVYTGEALPTDRESLFWLNVLEVPPKHKVAAGSNTLSFALRTRIKIIYRPSALSGDPREAMKSLAWRMVSSGAKPTVEASNPTPYNLALTGVQLVEGGKAVGALLLGDVPPLGKKSFSFSPEHGSPASDLSAAAPTAVRYHVVDDSGVLVDAEGKLQP